MAATITSKVNGTVTSTTISDIAVSTPSVIQLPLSRSEIASYQQDGLDLLINLSNGEVIRIENFFAVSEDGLQSDLVLEEADGTLWWMQHSDGLADFQ